MTKKEEIGEAVAQSKSGKKTVKSILEGVEVKKKGIAQQKAETTAAVKKIAVSVRKLQDDIQEQVGINAAAEEEIDAGARKIIADIGPIKGKIREHKAETRSFIRAFYG